MNMKFNKIVFSIIAISLSVVDISCMEGQWICKKTIILPNKVSCVSLDENVKKVDQYTVLLRHYNITDYPSDPTCSVVACGEKNNLYATLMIDALGGNWMFAGDIKDMKEGWADGNMYQPTDVCFNKDGSLVAFASGSIVLVYVTAILEKSNQVRHENSMAHNDTIKKGLEGL